MAGNPRLCICLLHPGPAPQRDEGSLNGTLHNGRIISSADRQPGAHVPVADGDELAFGSVTRVRVRCCAQRTEPAPPLCSMSMPGQGAGQAHTASAPAPSTADAPPGPEAQRLASSAGASGSARQEAPGHLHGTSSSGLPAAAGGLSPEHWPGRAATLGEGAGAWRGTGGRMGDPRSLSWHASPPAKDRSPAWPPSGSAHRLAVAGAPSPDMPPAGMGPPTLVAMEGSGLHAAVHCKVGMREGSGMDVECKWRGTWMLGGQVLLPLCVEHAPPLSGAAAPGAALT
jgi:hypothetical protein